MTILLAVASLGVGFLIGCAGVGGVLIIPLLALLGGLSIHEAMGTGLFSFFFTGIICTYIFHKHGSIDWGITIPVCIGSFVSSYFGAYANAFIPAFYLKLLLALVIIASSLYAMRGRPARPGRDKNAAMSRGRATLVSIGVFVGFLSGMTGAGGGIVSIPLMLMLGFAPMPTIATGQVLQGIVAISGSIGNLQHGFVAFPLVWLVVATEVTGAIVGASMAHKLPMAILKKFTTLTCLALGGFLLVTAFF